jgi:DDE superfamily endonuclease
MEIRAKSIARFANEVNLIRPLPDQLLFLDDMSTDSRSMLRKKGWFLKNSKPFFRGIFTKSSRISILAFLGVAGLVEVFKTQGTFDLFEFMGCVRQLVQSEKVQPYPGRHSVWILDGASIHLSKDIVGSLRASGIMVIFLPAYCPFYNPIEVLFGLVKGKC